MNTPAPQSPRQQAAAKALADLMIALLVPNNGEQLAAAAKQLWTLAGMSDVEFEASRIVDQHTQGGD